MTPVSLPLITFSSCSSFILLFPPPRSLSFVFFYQGRSRLLLSLALALALPLLFSSLLL